MAQVVATHVLTEVAGSGVWRLPSDEGFGGQHFLWLNFPHQQLHHKGFILEVTGTSPPSLQYPAQQSFLILVRAHLQSKSLGVCFFFHAVMLWWGRTAGDGHVICRWTCDL